MKSKTVQKKPKTYKMMMKRYAKWMHGDKNKIEMGKLKTD